MVTSLICVVPPESVVRLESGVIPPTAELNLVVPAVFTVNVLLPLTVPVNVTLPLPVLARVVAAPSVAAPVNDWPPVVVIWPPLRAEVPVTLTLPTVPATPMVPPKMAFCVTLKAVTLATEPTMLALPVMVNDVSVPVNVLDMMTLAAVRVRFDALTTAPV